MSITEGFHLSQQQRRLWQHQPPRGSPYRARGAIAIEGCLDLDVLKAALQRVVRRHEITRTAFRCLTNDVTPVQVITDAPPVWEGVHDLRGLEAAQQQLRIAELFARLAETEFDLEIGAVVHATVVMLASTRHVLLVVMPALCADALTLGTFMKEIGWNYAGDGHCDAAAEDVLQYADFAAWQHELLESAESQNGRDYWRNRDPLMDVRLPFTSHREIPSPFAPRLCPVALPPEVLANVEAAARRYDMPESLLLLVSWQVLVWRITAQSELVLGLWCDGRTFAGLEDAMGPYGSYVPLRYKLEADIPWSRLLSQMHTAVCEARNMQEYFSWDAVPNQHDGPAHCFNVGFAFYVTPPRCAAGDISLHLVQYDVYTEPVQVQLLCWRHEDGLHLAIGYNQITYYAGVEWLAENLRALLTHVLSTPDTAVGDVDLLGAETRQRLLVTWNDTASDYPRDRCVHALFESQAQSTPERVALVCGDESLTYAALDRRANRLANHLQRLGVGPESLVGLYVERSVEIVVALLGILKAGGAYVPLDPSYPKDRLVMILEDAQARFVVTTEDLVTTLNVGTAATVVLSRVWKESTSCCNAGVLPDQPAYVLYTSGSTGRPKGVVISHRALVNFLWSMQARPGLSPSDVLLAVTSLSFDISGLELYLPLLLGGRTIICGRAAVGDGVQLLALMREHGVTVLQATPATWRLLLAAGWEGGDGVKSLCGGEALPLELAASISQRAGALWNMYGPTETTIWSALHPVRGKDADAGSIPIGGPIANTRLYLLDARQQPVAVGVTGEIYIGGVGLARGYHRRAALTAEGFMPDPFNPEPGARMYRTRDVGRYRPDGTIEFLGRLDHQVKVRGHRIELGEIEAVLLEHAAVSACVAAIHESVPAEQRLVAYVVAHAGVTLTTSVLRDFLAERLPDYMVPSIFVLLDTLPLTPNGKIDRQRLPAPTGVRPQLAADFVGPRNGQEEQLAQIWCAVLSFDWVGVHDNFFALGGDSILSIQIVGRAAHVGVRFTPRQLFEHPTIAELARVADVVPTIQAEQGVVMGDVPLMPMQRWFLEREPEVSDHYNQSVLLSLDPALPAELLERAVHTIVLQHDALRLRFRRDAAGWRQSYGDADTAVRFEVVDLSSLPHTQQLDQLERNAIRMQRSLSLTDGPVMQVGLFELGHRRGSRLLIVLHHLVVDEVSWQLLLEDFDAVCQQLRHGVHPQLAHKTTSVKQWVERLTAFVQGGHMDGELSYWLHVCEEPLASLPIDYNRGPYTAASARTVSVSLDEAHTRALLYDVEKAYRSDMHDVLLTALLRTISRWTGNPTLLLNLEGRGREEIVDGVDVSRTVGCFSSPYQVRLCAEPSHAAAGLLKAVKEQLRQTPRRGIGYGLLRYLHPDRGIRAQMAVVPQPQLAFRYLGQLEHLVPRSVLFRLAEENTGPVCSPHNRREHLLEIHTAIAAGRLHIHWMFSKHTHRRETIEALANDYVEALLALIDHCLSPQAGGYTPSDFPLAQLDQQTLDALPLGIDDIYPLTKMQEMLLYHGRLRPAHEGVYHCQHTYHLRDATFSLEALEQACRAVFRHNPVLRTTLMTLGGRPFQAIRQEMPLPLAVEDIRHLDVEAQNRCINAWIRDDRQRPFARGEADEALARLHIFLRSPETLEFCMSMHHAIIDGWSYVAFLQQLVGYYRAAKHGAALPSEAAPNVYKEFVALERESLASEAAAAFWERHLETHQHCSLEPLAKPEPYSSPHEKLLHPEVIATVRRLQRDLRVAPKAVFLAAFLECIGALSRQQNVAVGVVSNTRSPRLSDPLTAIGLFWNIVPFCCSIAGDQTSRIRRVQDLLVDIEPHVIFPLTQIESRRGGASLFFATLNFVHLHNASQFDPAADVQLLGLRGHDKYHFPLNVTVVVSPYDGSMKLQVAYDPKYFEAQRIRLLADEYHSILAEYAVVHPSV